MINQETFDALKKEFGDTSSWTIWSDSPDGRPASGTSDMTPFHNPNLLSVCQPNYVFVGLNPARHNVPPDTEPWQAFHSKDNKKQRDYKLRYALKGTRFWGSFITDLYPDIVETNSDKAMSKVGPTQYTDSINSINRIREILGNPVIIALGWKAYRILKRFFPSSVQIVKATHYSSYISKENYRQKIAKELANV